MHSYRFKGLDNQALNVTLVETGARILTALPSRISTAAHQELTKLGVLLVIKAWSPEPMRAGLHTKNDKYIQAELDSLGSMH